MGDAVDSASSAIDLSALTDKIVDSLDKIAGSIVEAYGDIVTVAIPVLGGSMVIMAGIKFFRRLAK